MKILAILFVPLVLMAQTSALAPVPIQQPLSNSGLILPGGCLYIYQAGTTTPQDTWNNSDLASNHKNTNPIVLDAFGRSPAIYQTTSIKMILAQKSLGNCPLTPGTVLWSQDNVFAGALILKAALAAATGATLIGFEPTGGNVAITVASALNTELIDAGYSTFGGACSAAFNSGKSLVVGQGWLRMASVTLQKCNIRFVSGGRLQPDSGQTVTFTGGSVTGDLSQHFDTSAGGSFAGAEGAPMMAEPASAWVGIVSSSSVDQTNVIQRGINIYAALGQNHITFPTGDFYFTAITLPSNFGVLCSGIAGYNSTTTGPRTNLVAYGSSTADMITVGTHLGTGSRDNWVQGCYFSGGGGPARSAVATFGTVNFQARYNLFNGTFGDAAFYGGGNLYSHWEDNEFSMAGYAVDQINSYNPIAYYGCSACHFIRNIVSATRGVRFTGYNVISRDNDYELNPPTPYTVLSFRDSVSVSGEAQGDYFEISPGVGSGTITAIDGGIGTLSVRNETMFGHGFGHGNATIAIDATNVSGGGVYGTSFGNWDYDVKRNISFFTATDNSWGSPGVAAVLNTGGEPNTQPYDTWQGSVTTNGTAVSNTTPQGPITTNFDVSGLWNGRAIRIDGTLYTISSVTDINSLVLTGSAGVHSGSVVAVVYDVPVPVGTSSVSGEDPIFGYVMRQGIRPVVVPLLSPTVKVNVAIGQQFFCGDDNMTLTGITPLAAGPIGGWLHSGFFWIYNFGAINCALTDAGFHLAAGHDIIIPNGKGLAFQVFVDGSVHEVGTYSCTLPSDYATLNNASAKTCPSVTMTDGDVNTWGSVLSGGAAFNVMARWSGSDWTVVGK